MLALEGVGEDGGGALVLHVVGGALHTHPEESIWSSPIIVKILRIQSFIIESIPGVKKYFYRGKIVFLWQTGDPLYVKYFSGIKWLKSFFRHAGGKKYF